MVVMARGIYVVVCGLRVMVRRDGSGGGGGGIRWRGAVSGDVMPALWRDGGKRWCDRGKSEWH